MELTEIIIAACAVYISAISVYLAHKLQVIQKEHYVLSTKPLPTVTGYPYTLYIEVVLSNHGVGPLVIKKFDVTNSNGSAKSLYDILTDPESPVQISYYTINMEGRAVSPGKELKLIRIESDFEDPEDPIITKEEHEELQAELDKCRQELASTTITIEYTDLHETHFKPYKMKLDIFEKSDGENT